MCVSLDNNRARLSIDTALTLTVDLYSSQDIAETTRMLVYSNAHISYTHAAHHNIKILAVRCGYIGLMLRLTVSALERK